jgi:hypothetical protein
LSEGERKQNSIQLPENDDYSEVSTSTDGEEYDHHEDEDEADADGFGNDQKLDPDISFGQIYHSSHSGYSENPDFASHCPRNFERENENYG